MQWNVQREIRKAVQGFTKSILMLSEEIKDKAQLMQTIKILQTSIATAIKVFEDKQ